MCSTTEHRGILLYPSIWYMVSEHCGIRLPNVVENGDRKLLYMAAEPLWYMAIQLCGVCPPNNCGICLWDRLGYQTLWHMAT